MTALREGWMQKRLSIDRREFRVASTGSTTFSALLGSSDLASRIARLRASYYIGINT
jgi:hypothetical protein